MTSAIVQMLVANAGVQAVAELNKAGSKYKVFTVVADENEIAPYITVYKSGTDPVSALDKDQASDLDYPRITIACWSTTFRETELMFEAVRAALDNDSETIVGYNIQRVWLVDDSEQFDPKSKLFVNISSFGVEHKR
jgi:hypothetical protein